MGPPNEAARPRRGTGQVAAGGPGDATKSTGPTIGDLDGADIYTLARVLGQAYDDGPFECPYRWCRSWDRSRYGIPLGHSRACFVQWPGLARCFACGTTFTIWRLRRVVLEDPRFVRRLRDEIGAAA